MPPRFSASNGCADSLSAAGCYKSLRSLCWHLYEPQSPKVIVASFGGGVNSTAMLIGMHERGERVDLILFADTGGEKPHTYEHAGEFNLWLLDHGMPDIIRVARHTTVSKHERIGTYTTLEEDCLAKNMLPSIAYGFKACSQKYKREPQDKFCNSYGPCVSHWSLGLRVKKLIGYDADETRRANIKEDEKYEYAYPLIEWGWGRDECEEAVKRAGLRPVGKSACFYCPSSKKPEIFQLRRQYPDLAERAVAMERNAELTTVKGLGRNFAWGDLYAADDNQAKLFPDSPIEIDCGCYDGEPA